MGRGARGSTVRGVTKELVTTELLKEQKSRCPQDEWGLEWDLPHRVVVKVK